MITLQFLYVLVHISNKKNKRQQPSSNPLLKKSLFCSFQFGFVSYA